MMNVEDDGVILSCMFCKNELKSEKFQSNKKSSDYDELPEEYYNGQNNDVKNKNGVTIERCRSTTFSALAANVNAKMASQMQRTRSAPHLATGLKDEGCPCIQEKGVLYTRGEISGKITYSIRGEQSRDVSGINVALPSVPKLAPPEPPNRVGGAQKKGGFVNSQYVVLFNQRMIKVP